MPTRRPGAAANASGTSPASAPIPTSERLLSLDAYRGLIMLTLLCAGIFAPLAGHPTWGWLARHGEHVAWEGVVYWDLIQPAFMFMVGVAMPFAFAARASRGETWARQGRHAVKRAGLLVLVGVLLDHIGEARVEIGFIRVLQQIAFGYLVAFLVLGRRWQVQAAVVGAILIGYQILWMANPWNGPGGPWAQGTDNIGSAFDMWLIGRHYRWYYVGMNAIPSTATIILGVMAGQVLRTSHDGERTTRLLLLAAAAGIGAGLAVSPWFPIIKRIWTPSFTIYSAGWATLMLAAFYWLIDVRGWRRWAFPLVVVGTNSIAAYVMGNAFFGWFRDATQAWVGVIAPALGPAWVPALQRALFAATAWAVLLWLYRRRVFFKL